MTSPYSGCHKTITYPGKSTWFGIINDGGDVYVIGDNNSSWSWSIVGFNYLGMRLSSGISDHDMDIDRTGRVKIIGVDLIE